MKLRKYWYVGIIAGIMLSLAGCGEKEKEATEPEKAVTQEAEEKADAEKKEKKADKDDENTDEEFSIADVAGDKAAKLFEETSEEELLAMIPETEISVMGYYRYYDVNDTDDSDDIEICGYMKEFELISRDNECITVSGVVESENLKTEQPVQGIYFISINEDETALQLVSATVTDAPETVHIVPTVPFPTAEQLLDMGIKIKVNVSGFMDGSYSAEPILMKDYITEIWYDEEGLEDDLADWRYTGDVYFILNGYEHFWHAWLEYPPYEDKEAPAEWIFGKTGDSKEEQEENKVVGFVSLEESGIPEENLSWSDDYYEKKERDRKMEEMLGDVE